MIGEFGYCKNFRGMRYVPWSSCVGTSPAFRRLLKILFLAIGTAEVLVGRAAAEDGKGPLWRFGLGAGSRSVGGIQFETGSYSRLEDLMPFFAQATTSFPFGPATGFSDRTYKDGFVFRDINTEDPNSFLPGTTAYFGYERDDQIRNGSLFFNGVGSTGSFSQGGRHRTGDVWGTTTDDLATPVIKVEVLLPLTPAVRAGLQLSYMHVEADAARTSNTFNGFFRSSSGQVSVTDEYDLQGVVLPLAPYQGQYNPPGPAPLIDNIPTRRLLSEQVTGVENIIFFNRVRESLDIEMHTISLGATLEFQWKWFSLSMNGGLGMNIIDWSADFREDLMAAENGKASRFRSWKSHASDTDILAGFYLGGEVGLQIAKHCRLAAFARYDWTESLRGTVGPSNFSVDLDGQTVGGMVVFSF